MICSTCGFENSEQNRFCGGCGAAFQLTCPSCTRTNPAGQRFCGGCGASLSPPSENVITPAHKPRAYTPKHLADKILQSKSALEGERKQVTVLFADVKGSLALAGMLDPEHWHQILDRFFHILTEGVHRFEGTVNQYTGDGIMALFGAPIAHEDHAQRACYAALRLRDQLLEFSDQLRIERGIDFGVRIGINSGDVIVGRIGDDLRMDYTAQGHTVGLAQRIEQLAAPGRVYLSEQTQRLVTGFFNLRNLGITQIAGVGQPAGIYELEGVSASRTRLEVAQARGLTRFVGRQREMQTLTVALERAREGHGQVVGVVGDPGLGKSRLCHEFVERCRADGVVVFEAHCLAHGRNIPLIPVLELFRNYFEITPLDDSGQARRKIAGALVLLDPALQDALAVLFDFMGVADADQPPSPLDADARQRRLFALLRQVYRAQADRGIATVVMIDDVHWIDPASDDFVTQIVEATAENSRNLLLLNFRPEYSATWMRRAHYQQLPLVHLGIDAIQELVASLLGRDATLGDLGERIMRWTAGNPFYTEEIIHDLLEAGHLEGALGAYRLISHVDALAVPRNVRAVLAARIDRLPEPAKQLLQAASVIGKGFPAAVLDAICEVPSAERAPMLERLKAGDFIFETTLYPSVEYAFKHPLTQEVAYGSLLQQRRALLHAATARAIEARAGNKLEEQAALLASHWEAANEPLHAIDWHQRAARWCGMSNAAGALTHWERVRDLARALPGDRHATLAARACAQIMGIQWRFGGSSADLARDFEEGKQLALHAEDYATLAMMHLGYGAYRGVNLGYGGDYRKIALEALHYAELSENAELQFAISSMLQAAYMMCGDFREMLDVTAQNPQWAQLDDLYGMAMVGGVSPRQTLLVNTVVALTHLGRRDETQSVSKHIVGGQLLATFQEVGVYAKYWECRLLVLGGNFDAALAAARDLFAQAEKVQTKHGREFANLALTEVYLAIGDNANAAAVLCQVEQIEDNRRANGWMRGAELGFMSDLQLRLGQIPEARRVAEQAIAFSRAHELKWTIGPWLSLARACIAGSDPIAARVALADAQQLISETGAVIFQPLLDACAAAGTVMI